LPLGVVAAGSDILRARPRRRAVTTAEENHLPIRVLRALSGVTAIALLAACAAAPGPTVTTTWRDPDFKGAQFTKIFVVGLRTRGLTDQRGFENLMVSALASAGIPAVAGWQFVPTDRTPDQATMRAAIARSGADAALLVRMSDRTTETGVVGTTSGVVGQVGPGMYAGWYAPGIVTADYEAATIYTTLFDVATARPVWTFNPPTYGPATLQQDAPAFASDVAGMLRASGLVATL
jgi:hypothetical protein